MSAEDADRTLMHLLDSVTHAAKDEQVAVRDVLHEFGDRAITPFILLIALLLVSPLSGIPGTPTVAAIMIVTLSVQALYGRRRLWLPQWVLGLRMRSAHVRRAVEWMRRPCAFVDRHHAPRLQFLTVGPMRAVTLLICVIIPLGWPLLEVLPFVSSLGAGTVSLLSFGLFTRDGIYVLAGYCVVALSVLATFALVF